MRNIIDKLIGLFCIIVFITFLVNHGHIDFSGVDWVRKTTVEAIQGAKDIIAENVSDNANLRWKFKDLIVN